MTDNELIRELEREIAKLTISCVEPAVYMTEKTRERVKRALAAAGPSVPLPLDQNRISVGEMLFNDIPLCVDPRMRDDRFRLTYDHP